MKRCSVKFVSFLISICMLILLFGASLAAASPEYGMKYNFDSPDSGMAGGQIVICADDNYGEVELYWTNKGRPIDGYSPLATADLVRGETVTLEIQKFTAIPPEARQLVVFDEGAPLFDYAYTLPSSKIADFGEKLYSFGAVSDVHIPTNDGRDFVNALKKFQDYGCDFVGITGDIANDGTAAQLQIYKNIITPYNDTMPVYVAAGNHDARSGGMNLSQWENYTGHELYFSFEHEGDYFIFLGDNNWPSGSNNKQILTPEQLDWLELELEKSAGKNVYLFEHIFLNDTCGDIFYENGDVVYGKWFDETTEGENRFRSLMRKYDNVTFFNGHSHWKFYLQENNMDLNIFDGDGDYCTMVHIPSITVPRDFINQKRVEDSSNSEGYFVDVYENATLLRGYDFMKDKFYAYAYYAVDRDINTEPQVVNVDIDEVVIDAAPGTTLDLSVEVVERNNASTELSWSCTAQNGKITVSDDFTVSVAADTKPGNYTLTATSVVNPQKSDSVLIVVSNQDGTKENPCLITSEEDFLIFSDRMENGVKFAGKYFKQMCDLDLTAENSKLYREYNGCTYTREFLGIYDGGGYKIKAEISHNTRNTLFGYIGNDTERGVLMNINANVNVKNADYGCGLAYSIRRYGLVINCFSDSKVVGDDRAGCLFSSVYGYLYNCVGAGTCQGDSRGGVAAQWNGSSSRMKSNYYLDTCGAGNNATSNTSALTSVTAETLGSQAFITTMNSSVSAADSFITDNGFGQISAADLMQWRNVSGLPEFDVQDYDAGIATLAISGVQGQINGETITVKLPLDADITALTPEITLSSKNAVINGIPSSGHDFTQPLEFTVTAKNGLVRTYTVVVVRERGIRGDMDENGIVNVLDVVLLRQLIMSSSWTEDQLATGDMDENGTLNVSDVVALSMTIMNQ